MTVRHFTGTVEGSPSPTFHRRINRVQVRSIYRVRHFAGSQIRFFRHLGGSLSGVTFNADAARSDISPALDLSTFRRHINDVHRINIYLPRHFAGTSLFEVFLFP